MFGYIVYESGERRGRMAFRNLLGVRVLEAAVPGRRRLYGAMAARRLAAAMRKAGVTQAVFPRDFPFAESFWRKGVLPVSTLELYRALAGRAVKEAMTALSLSPGEVTVAVLADRVTVQVEELITELCMTARYVVLQASRGGEDLCRRLKGEYGVSVLYNPGRSQVEEADLLVELAPPPPELRFQGRLILPLYDGERVVCRSGIRLELPPKAAEAAAGCEAAQLLAVLYRSGVLQKYQIPLKIVDIPGKTHYNASIVE